MNLENLVQRYTESPKVQTLAKALSSTSKTHHLLSGIIGAQEAFVVGGVFKNVQGVHFIVVKDREDAAYLQNNLSELLEKKDVFYYPDSFRRVARFEEIAKESVLQRTEVVSRLVNDANQSAIVVTYPEALFEKVVAPQFLKKTEIEIGVNQKLDVEFLSEVLVEYGFERTDFVYEPGQFSIRGSIVDIYSYGNEFPYRVELFDEDVESIRTFNPNTQLSERKIAKVNIIPNINTKFDSKEKTSILKLLPENACIWIHNVDFMMERLEECFDRAQTYTDKIEQLRQEDRREEAELLEEKSYMTPKEILNEFQAFSIVEIGKSSYFKKVTTIEFCARPQPAFSKNFKLLITDLTANDEAGFTNIIFAEQVKQIERFYNIFEDSKATMRWFPIQKALNSGFIDDDLKVVCYTDHQIFERYHRFKTRQGFEKDAALTLRHLRELQTGDYVTHIDHGIGRYSGLEKINLNGQLQEAVRLIYRDNDVLYVSINSLHKISKYSGKDGTEPKIHKLGTDSWAATKRKAKTKIRELAFDLIQLYAKRKATKGHAFAPDTYLQTELEASFIYEDTPDQAKSTEDVKRDMERDYPMDRLICGDVGFGKTEIAIRAAFKAVVDGKQVGILVPTTILALQHAKTFNQRLKEFGVEIAYLNRFCTAKEKKEIFKKVEEGKLDILIGTHALLSDKVKFKDLGLLIIDEEQKFGVNAKEKIRNFKINVDTLTLTATPIPRTLQFSLLAARDLSVINTPPPNRQPIHTEVKVFNLEFIREAIYTEVARGGQVFFLHNRVQELESMAAMLRNACPDVDFAVAHGQLDSDKLEDVLLEFIEGVHDVLVCTNIIETGLDIPNANTMIINQAHYFGLSDLHQLRGRVGRSNQKAYCYLLCPPKYNLTDEAKKRLNVIEEFSDLGSGFQIAMKDLDIRGAGNLLGGEQSGFIFDIGYETYQKILDEAIRELKQNEYKDLFREDMELRNDFVKEVNIETDVEMLIPDAYIRNIQERLSLYTELDNIENEEDLTKFGERLTDRFGKLPRQVLELFEGLRLRWVSRGLGFERIVLKGGKLRCYFLSNPQSSFYETERFQKLMAYLSKKADHRMSLKQTEKSLILNIEGVKKLADARKYLTDIDGNANRV